MLDKLSPGDFPANPLEKTGYTLESNFGEKRLLIMSLASYEKFWYNGLKLIPLFISVIFVPMSAI